MIKRHLPWLRGDCEGGPRPCPILSCRYNLGLEIYPSGAIKPTAWLGRDAKDKDKRVSNLGRAWYRRRGARAEDIASLFDKEIRAYWKKHPSCALDVADEGPQTLEGIAHALNTSKERVRQIEQQAMKRAAAVAKELGLGDLRSLPVPGLY